MKSEELRKKSEKLASESEELKERYMKRNNLKNYLNGLITQKTMLLIFYII